MPIINFSVPKDLEKRVKETIKERGFPSKAELFRFAVIRYLDELEMLPLDKNKKMAALSQELARALEKKSRKRLPSIKKQLAKIKRL